MFTKNSSAKSVLINQLVNCRKINTCVYLQIKKKSCMEIFNFQKLNDHFQQTKTHSIYIDLFNGQIKCFSCEYEVFDSLKFGETIEENYLLQIRQLLLNQYCSKQILMTPEFSNLNFKHNLDNILLSSILLFSQLKQIKKIFDKPLLRTDLTGFHQKIHSSFITSMSRLLNSISENRDTKINFQKFYFSLLQKSQKFGSYKSLDFQTCFLDLIQITHDELKKQINIPFSFKDSILELKELQKHQQQEISELSTNFTGKIRIEKSCSQCCYSNHFVQDFFQIKFQNMDKNDKGQVIQNREFYQEFFQQQEKNSIGKFIQKLQRFRYNIVDLIYVFLSQEETAKNSKNSFDFYDKLSDRFDFLENQCKDRQEQPNFCQQCFNDLNISYSLVDLPNILIFGTQNIKSYKLEIKQELDLSFFRGLNQKKNFFEFSTKSINKIHSYNDLKHLKDNYSYKLQSFITQENQITRTYFKNKNQDWFMIDRNSLIKISKNVIDKIIKKLKNLDLCVYEKSVLEHKESSENLCVDEKPSFVPRLLIQSLNEQNINSKTLLNSFFCDHLKLKTCYREIFGQYRINQQIQNQNLQDQKIRNLIQQIKNKNTTLLNYISESEILTLTQLEQKFQHNNLLTNFKMFQNPQQCTDCYKLLVVDQIQKIIIKTILYSLKEKDKSEKKHFYVEKDWLKNFFDYLNSNKNLPKNSSISLQKKFDEKINKNFDKFKHTPYYQKYLEKVPKNFLLVLLDIFGGQIVFSKPYCQSIQSEEFNFRQKNLNSNIEQLINLIKRKQFYWCTKNKKTLEKFIQFEYYLDHQLKLKFQKQFYIRHMKDYEFVSNLKIIQETQNRYENLIDEIMEIIPQNILTKINFREQESDSLSELNSLDEQSYQDMENLSNGDLEMSDQKDKVNFFSQIPKISFKENKAINSFLIGDKKTQNVTVDKIKLEAESYDCSSDENNHLNISQSQDKNQYSNSKVLRLLCGDNVQNQQQQKALITIEPTQEQSKEIKKIFDQLTLNFKIDILKHNTIKKISNFGQQDGYIITQELSTERSALTKKSNCKEIAYKQRQADLKKISKQNTKNLFKKTNELFEKTKIFMPNRQKLQRKNSYFLLVSSSQKKPQFQKQIINTISNFQQENQKTLNTKTDTSKIPIKSCVQLTQNQNPFELTDQKNAPQPKPNLNSTLVKQIKNPLQQIDPNRLNK